MVKFITMFSKVRCLVLVQLVLRLRVKTALQIWRIAGNILNDNCGYTMGLFSVLRAVGREGSIDSVVYDKRL
jgi:hypothetical protein